LRAPRRGEPLRPDDHLPNPIAVLARYREGFIDALNLPGMSKQWCKPPVVRVKQFEGPLRLVVRSAHVENGKLLAPHC